MINSLHVDQTGVALLDIQHLLVDLALIERLMILGDFKALVLAEDDLGIDGDLKGVDELLVVVDLLIFRHPLVLETQSESTQFRYDY